MDMKSSDDKPGTPRRGSAAEEGSDLLQHFNSEPLGQPPGNHKTIPKGEEPKAKRPTEETYKYGESAAVIRAVCAMPSAAQIEEDRRKAARTWRERWRDWKDEFRLSSSQNDVRNEDPGLRPIDRGSAARLNVWGVGVRDPNRYSPSGRSRGKK